MTKTSLVQPGIGAMKRKGWLDIPGGFRLFFNRELPLRYKLTAVVAGIAITAAVVAMELPLETIVGGLLNLPGITLDLLVDGAEIVIGPVLFAAITLPHIARKRLQNIEINPVQ